METDQDGGPVSRPITKRKMVVHELSESEGDEDEDLSEFASEYEEAVGPELPKELASMVKNVWNLKKDSDKVKEMVKLYPRPENVPIKKVEINPEFQHVIYAHTKKRDDKFKSVQDSITKAAYPILQACKTFWEMKPKKDVAMLKVNLHALSFLGSAWTTILRFVTGRDTGPPSWSVSSS